MRAAAAVVAVATAAAILCVAVGLASEANTPLATNSTLLSSYLGAVQPGDRLCQRDETIPAGAAELEVFAGVFGKPGPRLELQADGRLAGAAGAGYRDGWTRIPLAEGFRGRAEPLGGQRLCLVNRGRSQVAFAGRPGPRATAARIAGDPAAGRLSMRWTPVVRKTWWTQAPELAQRATFGKADLGPWTPVALVLLVWSGAFALILRSAR